jgi:two-component system, response regulator
MPNSIALADCPSVIVVEDSDEDFDTLLDAARETNMNSPIHRAVSGGACLAMLKGDGRMLFSQSPALILMDLNSHGIDGREALSTIKKDPLLKHIPLVVLTTSSNAKDIAFCYAEGANAYHVKPVRHDQYLLLLGDVLHYWVNRVILNDTSIEGV